MTITADLAGPRGSSRGMPACSTAAVRRCFWTAAAGPVPWACWRATATPMVATAGAWSRTCGRLRASRAAPCTPSRCSLTSRRPSRPAPPSCATGWQRSRSGTAACPSPCPWPTPPPRPRSGRAPTTVRRPCTSRPRSPPPPGGSPAKTRLWRRTNGWTGPPATAWTRWLRRSAAEHAIELLFILDLLDTLVDGPGPPEAKALLARFAATLPASAELSVGGGLEDEKLRPLDLSPWPDRPSRRHIAASVIEADLDRLAGEQRPDGGWDIDFQPYSPAAALEWRGYATVRALTVLARPRSPDVTGPRPGLRLSFRGAAADEVDERAHGGSSD